jgi:hypothetical protein
MSNVDRFNDVPEIILSTDYVDATGFAKAEGGGLIVSTEQGAHRERADPRQVIANLLHMAETYLVLHLHLPQGVVSPKPGDLGEYRLTRERGRDILYLTREQLRALGSSIFERALEECA